MTLRAGLKNTSANPMDFDHLPKPTIGILYPGELGARLADCISSTGVRVVTTLEGRSARTVGFCRGLDIEILASMEDVALQSDVVFSIVVPNAAVTVADEYLSFAADRTEAPILVDVNSISPERVCAIQQRASRAGVALVDAKVHGLAANLSNGAVMYLSGSEASLVARLLPRSIDARCLGDRVGQAAALKMFLGGLNKILTALFLELGAAAGTAGVLDEFLERTQDYYPGIVEVVNRVARSLPQHFERRADEMGELAETLLHFERQPAFAREAAATIADFGQCKSAELFSAICNESDFGEVVRQLVKEGHAAEGQAAVGTVVS